MSYRAATVLVVSLILASTAGVDAQPQPGDAVVVTSNRVLNVTPGGVVTTLSPLPTGHIGLGICTAFGNQGVAVLTRKVSSRASTIYLMDLTAGVWKTLGFRTKTGLLTIGAQGGVERDYRGDYIAATPHGILRIAGAGGAVKLIRNTAATGIADHLQAGDWMAFAGGQVLHVNRRGAFAKLGNLPGPTILGAGGIFADTPTGNAYVSFSQLYYFDTARRVFTTLRGAAGLGTHRCGDMDPASQTLVVGTSSGIYRLSRTGAKLTTFAKLSTPAIGLTVFGSSQVAVFGPSNPGTIFTVLTSFPTDKGELYQLGAALGFRPGIPTKVGVIPLNPDAFFGLVFAVPALFPGFGGKLDASGNATARILIPKAPALVGLRFFVAGLTYNNTGRILSISEPVGVAVE